MGWSAFPSPVCALPQEHCLSRCYIIMCLTASFDILQGIADWYKHVKRSAWRVVCHVGHQALAMQHTAMLPGVVLLDLLVSLITQHRCLSQGSKCSGVFPGSYACQSLNSWASLRCSVCGGQ